MIKNLYFKKGFTLVELLISVAILSIILLAICLFVFWMNFSKSKTDESSRILENARMALDVIAFEIKKAESVYTPTTSSSQLSLETTAYLPENETISYIDFFLCGSSLCLKKELQEPLLITEKSVVVEDLQFTQILTNSKPSVRISMTVAAGGSSIILKTASSLRNY